MQIWVDADACPRDIKDILCRAAERRRVQVTMVANRYLRVPPSDFVAVLVAAAGVDEADEAIAARVVAGDLVVTSDIPLASQVIEKGGQALSPRGELYTVENVGARLNMRDFLESLRSSGSVDTGGPPPLGQADRQAFADHLDRILTRALRPPAAPGPAG
ncbi:MAG: YaiI/YqxD family protein [Gemmatimonadota bacterium]